MDKLNWEFAPTGGGPDDGINNSMIEHFSGNYNYHLAREIIQNSLDAKLDENEPVIVKFQLEYFTQEEFPGYGQFKEIISQCKSYWDDDDEDVQSFLNNALECLASEKIPFLKASDFNTKGLSGYDNDKKGGWYNLVKSRGSSSKKSGEGGSFGIGKGAPFAASNLRAVFYSTKNEKAQSIFQGAAEIVSFEQDGKVKRGSGSFGKDGQRSLRNLEQIAATKFWRKEMGLDIYIAGFKIQDGWVDELIKSVLRNFWYAIWMNDLKVTVSGTEINQNTIEELLTQYFFNEPFKDYVEPIGNPLQYYQAVKIGKLFEFNLSNLGKVKFYFKQIEERLNYVAMLRKSHMVVYSKRFVFPAPFVGVFVCDDTEGNKQLRKMEPPAHDKWDPARNKEKGGKVMVELVECIRECLDSLKTIKKGGVLDIPELYKYLPYDDGVYEGAGEGVGQYTGQESDSETSKLIQQKETFDAISVVDPYKVAVINRPDSDHKGGGYGDSGGSDEGSRGSGGGEGTNKALSPEQLSCRPFLIKKEQGILEYMLVLKSNIDCKCQLRLQAIGEEGSEKVDISEVQDSKGNKVHARGNRIISVYLHKNAEIKLNVKINSNFKYSIKVNAYEVQ